jgi:hypothetical protein
MMKATTKKVRKCATDGCEIMITVHCSRHRYCDVCSCRRKRDYYQEHKAEIRITRRQYYEDHRAALLAYGRDYERTRRAGRKRGAGFGPVYPKTESQGIKKEFLTLGDLQAMMPGKKLINAITAILDGRVEITRIR